MALPLSQLFSAVLRKGRVLPNVFQFVVHSPELPAWPLRCSNMRNRKRALLEFCQMPSFRVSFVAVCVFLNLFFKHLKTFQ